MDASQVAVGHVAAQSSKVAGVHRTRLRRDIDAYCEALAVRKKDAIQSRATFASSEAVAIGIDQIASVTGRKPESVLRSIKNGKLPAALIDGEWCAFTATISKAKPAPDAPAPKPQMSRAALYGEPEPPKWPLSLHLRGPLAARYLALGAEAFLSLLRTPGRFLLAA